MSAKDKIFDGGPAFPVKDLPHISGGQFYAQGMSLRDWFAGMALGHVIQVFDQHVPTSATRENFATEAYLIADAMLRERAKSKGEHHDND